VPPTTRPSPTLPPTRYLAPDGSDDAAGTQDAPWRTLAVAQHRLLPGGTLLVRGGTYHEVDVQWTASGAPGAPIIVRAFPGETPVFDGGGTDDRFLWLRGGAGDLVFADLAVTGYATEGTGVIVMNEGVHDLVLSGLSVQGARSGSQLDHLIYLAEPDVHDITIAGSVLTAVSGAAIHVFKEPAARAIRIVGNQISRTTWGVLLYSGTSDVQVIDNRFIDVDIPVKLGRASAVRLVGNVAEGGLGIVVVGPPVQADYIEEDNDWPAPVRYSPP
jgi:hypothetical protein